jgi:adenylosuccinate lyase
MIERYWGSNMKKLWSSVTKFAKWLVVELAVLGAREKLGQIPAGTAIRIGERTWMDEKVANAINRRDKEIRHDLNAFVEIMRLQIILPRSDFESLIASGDEEFQAGVARGLAAGASVADAGYFHDGMTSYDTEEPAMTMLLLLASDIIVSRLTELEQILADLARDGRGRLMIGRTHGQHAQPITFGVKCLNWLDMIRRARRRLAQSCTEVAVMKLSGAVGMYGTLGPEVEQAVAEALSLEPVIATQILPLDRRAQLVSEMALIGAIIEKIAFDLWLMSQTEVGEVREPFGKAQKSSSAMPHKKNPITLEQLRGLARHVRACAMGILENVATAHERDISHSSVERLEMVDAFGILDHMLRGLTNVLKGMEVFPGRMLANIDQFTYGTIASQRVEMLLKQKGMAAESAYRAVQRACAQAVTERKHLREVMLLDAETRPLLEHDPNFTACFDWKTWVEEEDAIYQRMGL